MVSPAPGSPSHWKLILLFAWLCSCARLFAEPPLQPVTGFFRKPQFKRGDSNVDGKVDLSDAINTLRTLFSGVAGISCRDAADANGDGHLDISDPVYTLLFLFLDGERPPPPGPRECGVDPDVDRLGCRSYPLCPDDFPLIAHVLQRITFGATEELLTQIQTKADLLRYIDEQLDGAPQNYDPALHEPDLSARVEALQIGFPSPGNPTVQAAKLKSSLLLYAMESRWQLLHVVSQFWNNHFHTQIDALVENFFKERPKGGPAVQATVGIFQAADKTPTDGTITEAEWNAFRSIHPGAADWEEFNRQTRADGALSQDEFLGQKSVASWKYGKKGDQYAVAADMEKREYDLYRRLAFRSFKDLIEAGAKSVPMLLYLNGFENSVQAPNENFAREVMELFGIGVDDVYTQRDIEQLARILTGWTVDWVSRAGYAPEDINFEGHPEAQVFPLNLREPAPLRFPTREFWDDGLYTWAFVFEPGRHDWGRKDLFLQRYGGVDSLGSPAAASSELTIPDNASNRTVNAALLEFEQFLGRLVGFRDCAKFISTKLIQLFVTDDLSLLEKNKPSPADLLRAFQAVDQDASGTLERSEWEAPVPLILPNGRPPAVFDRLDANGDGHITLKEYQDPDLLQASIDTWKATGGNIREVLRTILHSEEFLSLKFYRAKVKTPFETVTSAVRALKGKPSVEQLLLTANDLELAGMELFNFSDPTGESELGFDWMDTIGLLERLKYLNRSANPATPGDARFTWSPLDFQARWQLDTPEKAIDFFTLLLLDGDVLENHRALALDTYVKAPANKIPATLGFLLSLPQFAKQ